MTTKTIATGQIGRSVRRLEAREKVTGRAEYIFHLRLPGMLHAKIFRSTVAHGRIKRIDVSAAAAMEGVYQVVTGQDVLKVIPDPYYGPAFADQPILAIDKVHHVGDPVAVVLAEDPHVAQAATQLIEAEYEELPAVFDEVEAMNSDVFVHDALRPSGMFAHLKYLAGRKNTNVALDYKLRRGDVEAGFAKADRIFEHTFHTQQVMHTPLEPMVSVADVNESSATVYTSSQSPSYVRIELARLLGWPENRIRVKTAFLGGGFGAKLYCKLEPLAAALSMLSGRPVKVLLSMEEQFYTITRHGSTFRIKSGVTKDGRVIARQCEVWWNGGAYAEIGPSVTQKSGFTSAGPYDIENIHIDSYSMYTNLPLAGALRGFGIPQIVWGYEGHTDIIAHALNIDPLEFRRKNLLRNGRPHATGTVMRDAEIEAVLDKLAATMNWSAPFVRGNGTKRRGRGIALGMKASVAPTTSVAMIKLFPDGSCTLYCSTVDMGQGSDTALAQIVAETLNIETEVVKVVRPDTDVTPYDNGTLGSRSLFHVGLAAKQACEDVLSKVRAMAAEVGLPPGSNIPLPEIFNKKYGMQAGTIVGVGSYIPSYSKPDHDSGQSPNVTPFWMIGGCGAEVEVDTETGHVRVTRLVNVADAGKIVNPDIVSTQLSGGAIMQFGFTMSESMNFDGGQVTNASLADYKIPGMHDIPPMIQNEVVEGHQHDGPYGAKGVGETPTFAVSAAIANALHDAIGVRITSMPLTSEAVYRAMRAAGNDPLEDE